MKMKEKSIKEKNAKQNRKHKQIQNISNQKVNLEINVNYSCKIYLAERQDNNNNKNKKQQ